MTDNPRLSFYGATSAGGIVGAAFMWAWWDLAVYTDIFRNWMMPARGFSAELFVIIMISAAITLYCFARFAPKAAEWLYDAKSTLICVGLASVCASGGAIAGAWFNLFWLECIANASNGVALGFMLALWGSVMAERGAKSGILNSSLAITLGAVFDAVVIYIINPLYAAGMVAFFPLISILVFIFIARHHVDNETFLRKNSTRALFGRQTKLPQRELYGISLLFLLGLSIAEIAFNFMNYQMVYASPEPVGGLWFNYGCHVARAAGAFVCFVFVGLLGVSYKRFFWAGGSFMAFAFASMPFWSSIGIPPYVSNYINMACFAMVVIFVFGVLCEISYERKTCPLEPLCFGSIFITGIDSVGVVLGLVIDNLLGDNAALVAAFTCVLGYTVVFALLAIMTEGQRYLDTSTGVAAGRRLQTDEEIIANQKQTLQREKLIEEAGLTLREREVLADLLRDKNPISIAHTMGISENTVKTHVQSIYRKMGVHGRQELLGLPAFAEATQAVSPEIAQIVEDSKDTTGQIGPNKKAALDAAFDQMAHQYGLTKREAEVLALLVRGYRHSEIQEKLSVSASTVHSHVTSIYTKTGLHSQAELSKQAKSIRDQLIIEQDGVLK